MVPPGLLGEGRPLRVAPRNSYTPSIMNEISYITGGMELLDAVAPLWEELNRHHRTVSEHFADAFAAFTFEVRRQPLVEKAAQGRLRVDLAKCGDGSDARYCGYCVSSIDTAGVGEVDSIYVCPEHRGQGVGDGLMRRALGWMDAEHVKCKTIVVVWGNEQVLPFYQRYGFYPRAISLRQR